MANKTRATDSLKHPQWDEIIKQIREALGETQEEFGKRFNVSQPAVAYWENGTVDPPGEVTWWVYHQDLVAL